MKTKASKYLCFSLLISITSCASNITNVKTLPKAQPTSSSTLKVKVIPHPDLIPTSSKIKILPIGDSITSASQYKVSYRYPLWKHLIDAGKNVEYVGSQKAGKGNFGRVNWPLYKGLTFSPVNEAHSGWRTDQVLNGLSNDIKGIDSWLTGYRPDIALIHLGTNDTYQSQTPESTRDELELLILKLRKKNPTIKVLLASIIPMATGHSVLALNQQLASLAAKLNQPHSPVVNVDMYTGFSTSTDLLHDKLHPSASGENKMAKRWFDALILNKFL